MIKRPTLGKILWDRGLKIFKLHWLDAFWWKAETYCRSTHLKYLRFKVFKRKFLAGGIRTAKLPTLEPLTREKRLKGYFIFGFFLFFIIALSFLY